VEKPHDLVDVPYSEIHDEIFPTDVKPTKEISAKLRPRDSGVEFESIRVHASNPLGIEIIAPDFLQIHQGMPIDVQLQTARQITNFEGLVVEISEDSPSFRVAGIRLFGKKENKFKNRNRRNAARWICSSQHYPVATSPNPVEFNDFLYLRIKDISSSGFRAITSLRNKFLVPGMQLSLQISFPMVGHINVAATIARAKLTAEDGKDYLELGFEFNTTSRPDRTTIGQYLAQFGEPGATNPLVEDELTKAISKNQIQHKFVRTETEFRDTLELRQLTTTTQPREAQPSPEPMASDIYDARSRILNWSYKGCCVGTARTTFCDQDDTLPIEKWMDLPREFPRRDQLAEISGISTHPGFRDFDVMANILQRCSILCLQAKRSFLIVGVPSSAMRSFEELGLVNSGLTYIDSGAPEGTMHVLYGDIERIISGKNTGLLVWSGIWKEVYNYASEIPSLGMHREASSRLRAYNFLSPLGAIVRFFLRHPRKTRQR